MIGAFNSRISSNLVFSAMEASLRSSSPLTSSVDPIFKLSINFHSEFKRLRIVMSKLESFIQVDLWIMRRVFRMRTVLVVVTFTLDDEDNADPSTFTTLVVICEKTSF